MFLLLVASALAHDGPRIEQEHTTCLARPDSQSTIGMIACTDAATKAWDAELNRIYGALTGKLDPAGKKKLQAAQRAWITFRDLDVQQIVAQADQQEGTMYRLNAAGQKMQLTQDRAIELAERLADFEAH